MKVAGKLIILTATFFTLTADLHAASPQEELAQMVGELEKAPKDVALRERLIKFGAEMKPAPAMPEEANRAFVKGNVFQKEAKDASGYELAISAYREALRIAPWWGDAYFNLAVAEGSAGKFAEAIASTKLYMASVPIGSTEARDAQNRVYVLEAKGEMVSAQAAAKVAADTPDVREITPLQKVEGAKFVDHTTLEQTGGASNYDLIFEIKNQILYETIKIYSLIPGGDLYGHNQPGEYLINQASFQNGAFTIAESIGAHIYQIRPDGQALSVRRPYSSSSVDIPRQ